MLSVWLTFVTGGAHVQRFAPPHGARLVDSGFLEEEEGAARAHDAGVHRRAQEAVQRQGRRLAVQSRAGPEQWGGKLQLQAPTPGEVRRDPLPSTPLPEVFIPVYSIPYKKTVTP